MSASSLWQGLRENVSKKFFSEEKNQKTFPRFAPPSPHSSPSPSWGVARCGATAGISCEAPGKRFLLLFFKKEALAFTFLLFSCHAHAATTQDYLTARDKAIATLTDPSRDPLGKREDLALAALEPMIEALVGRLDLPGFPPRGTSNVTELSPGVSFGALDGITADSADGKTRLIVSTAALTQAWLYRHQTWWQGQPNNPPADIESALASASFYTQAIATGTRFTKFADLPVTSSDKAPAAAILMEFSQDSVAPTPPDQMAVGVEHNGRIFLFFTHVVIDQIPACKTAYDHDNATAEDMLGKYQAGGGKSQGLFEKYLTLANAATENYRVCFGQDIASQPGGAALAQQAQSLVDLVTAGPRRP